MGFLSDPVRTKPGTLIACGVGLLLLGGALGHWLRGSRSVDDQTGAGSSDLGREKPLSTAKADAAPGRPGAPTVAKLLGVTPGIGDRLGLPNDWAYNVIKQVGNSAEIFDRNIGDDSPYKLERGLNGLWSDGGVIVPMILD